MSICQRCRKSPCRCFIGCKCREKLPAMTAVEVERVADKINALKRYWKAKASSHLIESEHQDTTINKVLLLQAAATLTSAALQLEELLNTGKLPDDFSIYVAQENFNAKSKN